jgi:hypothetical protein
MSPLPWLYAGANNFSKGKNKNHSESFVLNELSGKKDYENYISSALSLNKQVKLRKKNSSLNQININNSRSSLNKQPANHKNSSKTHHRRHHHHHHHHHHRHHRHDSSSSNFVNNDYSNINGSIKSSSLINFDNTDKSKKGIWNSISYTAREVRRILPNVKDINIIDKYSRLAFPSLFLLFNVCYWCFYYFLKKSI